jgi:transposase
MLSVSPATRIYVATEPVDLRLSFTGLFGWVKNVMEADPLSGHLFLFTNRRRNRLKVLGWDGSGLWVCTKRLERSTFGWPQAEEGRKTVHLRAEEFALLVHGVEGQSRSGWYRR